MQGTPIPASPITDTHVASQTGGAQAQAKLIANRQPQSPGRKPEEMSMPTSTPSNSWSEPAMITVAPPTAPSLDLNLAIPASAHWVAEFIAATAADHLAQPSAVLPLVLAAACLANGARCSIAAGTTHLVTPGICTVTEAAPAWRAAAVYESLLKPLAGSGDARLDRLVEINLGLTRCGRLDSVLLAPDRELVLRTGFGTCQRRIEIERLRQPRAAATAERALVTVEGADRAFHGQICLLGRDEPHLGLAWTEVLRRLQSGAPRQLALSPSALRAYRQLSITLRSEASDPRLPPLYRRWLAVAPDTQLQLAGILALLDYRAAAKVEEDAVMAAAYLIRYFGAHARTLYGDHGGLEHARVAARIPAWTQRQSSPVASRSRLQRAGWTAALHDREDWDQVFDILVATHHLRRIEITDPGYTPQAIRYAINPAHLQVPAA